MSDFRKHIMVTVISMISFSAAYSQPKSAGATFSFCNIGLNYEHYMKSRDAFIKVDLNAETAEMFNGRCQTPGVSTSITWNQIFREFKSSEGNPVKLFSGLGFVIGYASDFKEVNGLFSGLKGRVGGECHFSRNAIISIELSPIIGFHLVSEAGHHTLKYYKNGLIYTISPEIGIKYRF